MSTSEKQSTSPSLREDLRKLKDWFLDFSIVKGTRKSFGELIEELRKPISQDNLPSFEEQCKSVERKQMLAEDHARSLVWLVTIRPELAKEYSTGVLMRAESYISREFRWETKEGRMRHLKPIQDELSKRRRQRD